MNDPKVGESWQYRAQGEGDDSAPWQILARNEEFVAIAEILPDGSLDTDVTQYPLKYFEEEGSLWVLQIHYPQVGEIWSFSSQEWEIIGKESSTVYIKCIASVDAPEDIGYEDEYPIEFFVKDESIWKLERVKQQVPLAETECRDVIVI